MPFRLKISLAIVALLVVLIAVAPLLVAPGEPPGAKPLAAVAGQDAEYLTVEGVDLHIVRHAAEGATNGPGQPLIMLLHGFPFSAASFDDFAPLLAGGGAVTGAVVAVDMPGFGLSERPLGDQLTGGRGLDPYSPEGQVRLVRGLLDEITAGGLAGGMPSSDTAIDEPKAKEIILVGHDSGARLALDVALDFARAPGPPDGPRVAGLVLIGASPYTSSQRSWLARAVMNSPQLERLGPVFLRQIAQEPGVRILRAGWSDPTAIEQEDLDAYRRPWTVEGWDEALWQLTKADAPASLEGALGALDTPTLVVAGEEDGVVPTSETERLAAELPSATLELVPGCGHAVQEECPEELAGAVGAWLENLP